MISLAILHIGYVNGIRGGNAQIVPGTAGKIRQLGAASYLGAQAGIGISLGGQLCGIVIAAIHQCHAVVLHQRVVRNLVNVLVQFLLDIGAVAVPGGGVCRSQCLFLHGGEDIQRVAHGAICHLQHTGAGLGVGICLLQAANAHPHGFADRIK